MPRRRYLAVVWTPARPLRALVPADPRALIAATLAIGHQLAALHERGQAHGGVDPALAVVGADGAAWLSRAAPRAPARRCAAPEVLRGGPASAAADQYAFAATVAALWPPARLAEPRVRAALLRALAVEPADRWPRIDDLVRALTPRRRWAWPVVGLALVGAVARAWPW